MIWRKLLILSMFGLLLPVGGCRSARTDNYMELLNAEKRALEDRIYDWEYEYEILEDELEDVRAENERLRRKLQGNDVGPAIDLPPGVDSRGGDSLPDIVPPTVEFGVPSGPPGDDEPDDAANPSLDPASPDRRLMPEQPEGARSRRPSDSEAEDLEELPAPRVADADDRVETIAIHPILSQGADYDGKPGDDGLQVVLQPRNSANEFVPRAGPVTLALLDPAKQGSEAVIGRWTFESSETGQGLKQSGKHAGIHLHVAWADRSPESPRMRLYARYETADGRRVESQREVFLRLAGESTAWTPRQSFEDEPAASVARRQARPDAAPQSTTPPRVDTSEAGDPPVIPAEQPPSRPQWSPNR